MKKLLVVFIMTGLIVSLIGCGSSDAKAPATSSETKTTDTKKEEPKKEEVKKEEPAKPSGKITKAMFDKISNGMTYDQVKSIIGAEGEVMSEVGTKGDKFYTIMVMYEGEGGLGANANFTFQGNKLQAKAQMGLQ